MNLNTLLDLAIMIFAGMFCGRMAKHVHLPNVTGYLVAGLLIGPSVFGLLSEDFLTTINIISDVALGFIAFSIGNEFKMSYFKRVGVAPIVIACLESLFAVVFVVLGLLIAGQRSCSCLLYHSTSSSQTLPLDGNISPKPRSFT